MYLAILLAVMGMVVITFLGVRYGAYRVIPEVLSNHRKADCKYTDTDGVKSVQITILMQPVPKGRPRFTKGGFAYTPTKTRTAEKFIKDFLQGYPKLPADIPLAMTVTFYMVRPKSAKKRLYPPGDVDNYAKLVIDSLQGDDGIIPNDNQITRLLARKEYGDIARIEIEIEEVTNG